MINCLFVYGTLMRASREAELGSSERMRLETAGEWLGRARVNGRLYDRGLYPVLVAPHAHHETVYGEIFRLHMPIMTFRWLDIYEGIPPGQTQGRQYARVVRPVRCDGGGGIEAWAYLWTDSVGTARRVADGRWRAPARCGVLLR